MLISNFELKVNNDMSLPAAKRRRIDDAASTLSRPFKSPLKQTPIGKTPERKTETKEAQNIEEASELSPARAYPSSPITPRRHALRPYPQSLSSPIDDSPYAALLKEQRRLERALRDARSDLDTHEQALKIESDDKDEELERLIEKWRGVARNAADEMFSRVRDRVNRFVTPVFKVSSGPRLILRKNGRPSSLARDAEETIRMEARWI
jgi:Swi5-dependent recombination DNA repair protein 1